MNQNFSANQLIRFCNKNELDTLGLNKEAFSKRLETLSDTINNDTLEFKIRKKGTNFVIEDLEQLVLLRKLNDNIKRIYKVEQSNRRLIINQVITLLEENCPIYILKTDVQKFYESIDRDRIIEKLKNDALLSYDSTKLISKLFTTVELKDESGLPRGINISSTLSEIYLRKFDKWVKRYPGVYYYARFVDDIIIFANSKSTVETLQANINIELAALKLEINSKKTRSYDGNRLTEKNALEYLGYKFVTKIRKKNQKQLLISIADNKIKKIKTRLVLSFIAFNRDRNFRLLTSRIKFLTGNYSIRNQRKEHSLKAGIYYNYSQINDYTILDSMNLFYRKLVRSRMNVSLIENQKIQLVRYSFKHGFKQKVYHPISFTQMKTIKSCW